MTGRDRFRKLSYSVHFAADGSGSSEQMVLPVTEMIIAAAALMYISRLIEKLSVSPRFLAIKA